MLVSVLFLSPSGTSLLSQKYSAAFVRLPLAMSCVIMLAVKASFDRTDSAIWDNSPLQSGNPANIETPAPVNMTGAAASWKNDLRASTTDWEDSLIDALGVKLAVILHFNFASI